MGQLINAADAFKARRNESSRYAFSGSNWFPMDRNLLRDWKLSKGSRLAYMAIHVYRDNERPTSKDLMRDLGMGDRRLRGYLAELTEAGLITIELERSGRSFRKVIHLNDPRIKLASPPPDNTDEEKSSPPPDSSGETGSSLPLDSGEAGSPPPDSSGEESESTAAQGFEPSIYSSSSKRGLGEKNIIPPYTPQGGESVTDENQSVKVPKTDRSPLDAICAHAVNLASFMTYANTSYGGGEGGSYDQAMNEAGCMTRRDLLSHTYPPAILHVTRKIGPQMLHAVQTRRFSKSHWRAEAKKALEKLGKGNWGMDLSDAFSLPEFDFFDVLERFRSREQSLAAHG